MDFKKKVRKFFTLTRQSNAGFTLVELIVVIAVLAILAGVGSAGYAGYIKAANKGNDKVLVGNIIRAIETGAYSTMFTPSDSLQISATTYPVGFVILSMDGTNLLTSKTAVHEVAGVCEFENATVSRITSESKRESCGLSSHTETVYTITNESVQYCKTHGATPVALSEAKEYVTSFSGCTNSGFLHSHEWTTSKTTLPVGTLVADNTVKLASAKNPSLCEYAYANQNGIYDGNHVVAGANGVEMDTTNPLYQAIYAAYGDLGNLKLTYDGWTADEGIDFATFYSGASGVMDSVETLSGILLLIQNIGSFVEGNYDNKEEVLIAVTDKVLSTHQTEEAWLTVWNAAGDKTWNSEGFGLTGRENYSAVRVAYNAGFATYMAANGFAQEYCNIIKNFNAQELMGYGLPGLVCTDAFTNTESPLKGKFKNDEIFNQVAALFEQYKGSEACTENGRVFYKTMITFDETEEFASDKNNVYGGNMFDYYNAYVDEISGLYSAAQNAVTEGSILIIVTVNEGELQFQVSPSSANPRND